VGSLFFYSKKIFFRIVSLCEYLLYICIIKQTKTMEMFTYSLIKKTTYKGVVISLYSSTEGWFVETSESYASEYMKTKKEALDLIREHKELLKIESL